MARAPEIKVNRRIRAREIRLVADDNEQLGILPIDEALNKAEESGLDLVEVAPNASPPVCKIMDYGKYKYDLKKQSGAKKQKIHTLKEIKFRPNIGVHDLNVKVSRIREFLTEGHKTKVRIFFRGREITHPDRGRDLAKGILEDLGELATVESDPKLEGKNLVMVLSPAKKKET